MKNKIQADFISAFKAKDNVKKNTLGILKTKITEWEKQNAGKEITDNDIIGIISSEIKKREQTISMIQDTESELVKSEIEQKKILQEYLPKQLTEEEIVEVIKQVKEISSTQNEKQLFGIVMKAFSSNYKGQYDGKKLNEIVSKELNIAK